MSIWVVYDIENTLVSLFKTPEGAYSYMMAEADRWAEEYSGISESQALIYKQKLARDFKKETSDFSIGDFDSLFYLFARKTEVLN